MYILDDIVQAKREEVRELYQQYVGRSIVFDFSRRRRGLKCALESGERLNVIAEVKRASPSRGRLAGIEDPGRLAELYASAGASAVSVLTDNRYFSGSLSDLDCVGNRVPLPVLRKDFIIDELQVLQSGAAQVDAILLILAILSDKKAETLMYIAHSLGMECLVETHNCDEFRRALDLGAKLIGVNNRDLKTFETDITTTIRILESVDVPASTTVVSESGISRPEQARLVASAGVRAILVGEALVTSRDPKTLVDQLRVPLGNPGGTMSNVEGTIGMASLDSASCGEA